jgi:hypothetical protein
VRRPSWCWPQEFSKTSQPAIAAYEAGAKSPTWRTVERIATASGLASYPFVGRPLTRDQARSLALHAAIAGALWRQPDAVLDAARRNVATMLAANPHAAPLLAEWERIMEPPTREIAGRLFDVSEHGRELRQVTPFAGVLTARERAAAYRAFREEA